jgi:hypothetical protein
MITAALGFPNLVPERAAESGTTIPDLSGPWARNSFAYETPDAGLGSVEIASRLPSGARDGTTLVGDTTNPFLTPKAAEIVKRFAGFLVQLDSRFFVAFSILGVSGPIMGGIER